MAVRETPVHYGGSQIHIVLDQQYLRHLRPLEQINFANIYSQNLRHACSGA
jgi:hypothetical protein